MSMSCMLRRDGCLKLFQKPLDAKKVLKNRSKGIDITSALTSSRNNQVGDCMRPSLMILSSKLETLLLVTLSWACTCQG